MKQIIKNKKSIRPLSADDGYRMYIDRLWPRGLSHETFHYDSWDKAIAPSTELREWFHENPNEEWSEFKERYRAELLANPALLSIKEEIKDKPVVTLIYSSHDTEHKNAVVLRDILEITSNGQTNYDPKILWKRGGALFLFSFRLCDKMS